MSIPLSARYMLLSGLGFTCMTVMVKLATQQVLSPCGKNRTLLMARAIVGTLALINLYRSEPAAGSSR